MRDLYRGLSISPNADRSTIRTAIRRCNDPTLRTDAGAVLLNQTRREQYDRLHARLVVIGQLRTDLNLAGGAHWRGRNAADFTAARRARERPVWLTTPAFALYGVLAMMVWSGTTALHHYLSGRAPRPMTRAIVGGNENIPGVRVTVVNDSDQDEYLVFARPGSEKSALEFYVRAHERTKVTAPVGRYKVAYAIGRGWQGFSDLFERNQHIGSTPKGQPLEIEQTQERFGYILRIDPETNQLVTTRHSTVAR